MGSRYKELDLRVNPGPGQYDQMNTTTIPSVKFGTGQRQSIDSAEKKFIPGPGNYTGNYDTLIKSPPKFG